MPTVLKVCFIPTEELIISETLRGYYEIREWFKESMGILASSGGTERLLIKLILDNLSQEGLDEIQAFHANSQVTCDKFTSDL